MIASCPPLSAPNKVSIACARSAPHLHSLSTEQGEETRWEHHAATPCNLCRNIYSLHITQETRNMTEKNYQSGHQNHIYIYTWRMRKSWDFWVCNFEWIYKFNLVQKCSIMRHCGPQLLCCCWCCGGINTTTANIHEKSFCNIRLLGNFVCRILSGLRVCLLCRYLCRYQILRVWLLCR